MNEIVNPASSGVYYCVVGDSVFCSEDPRELYMKFGLFTEINEYVLFSYVATGRPLPYDTFFDNVKRLPAGHKLKLRDDGSVAINFYLTRSPKGIRSSSYEDFVEVMDSEAEKQSEVNLGKRVYVGLSGVDSADVLLALRKYDNPIAIHVMNTKIQTEVVRVLVDYLKCGYLEEDDKDIVDKSFIRDLYSNILFPVHHYRPVINILQLINRDRGDREAVIFFGDLCGHGQSFSTSLHYGSNVYYTYLEGWSKRLRFTGAYMELLSPKRFYDYLRSLPIPTSHYTDFVPFKSLKRIEGLDDAQRDILLGVFQKELEKTLSYSNFSRSDFSGVEAIPVRSHIFRSWLFNYFYQLLVADAASASSYFGVEMKWILNDEDGLDYLLNYQIPLSDVFFSKRRVYDFFRKKMGFGFEVIGNKARERLNKKELYSYYVFNPLMRVLGSWVKMICGDGIFQRGKRVFKKGAGTTIRPFTVNRELLEEEWSFRYLDYVSNPHLRRYFMDLEEEIRSSPIVSDKQDRYINLMIYLSKIKDRQESKVVP